MDSGRHMPRFAQTYVLTWTVQFVVMMALWFAFVAKMGLAETLIGVAAAAFAATGDAAIRRSHPARFNPRVRWLVEAWRILGYLAEDTAVIFKVLFRRLVLRKKPDSVLRSVPFDSGGNTRRASARRALALFFTTFPPNSIVIGIDQAKNSMLLHQLEPANISGVTKRLGAK